MNQVAIAVRCSLFGPQIPIILVMSILKLHTYTFQLLPPVVKKGRMCFVTCELITNTRCPVSVKCHRCAKC